MQVQRFKRRSHRVHTAPESSRLLPVPSRQQMVQPHQQEIARQVIFQQGGSAADQPSDCLADGTVSLPCSFEGFSSGKGVKVAGGAAAAPSSSSSQTAAAAPPASKATAGQSHINKQTSCVLSCGLMEPLMPDEGACLQT